MKTIILFLSIILSTGCAKENHTPNIPDQTNDILHSWHLTKYEGGFSPTFDYTNEIKWVFDANNTVDVFIENGTNVSSGLPLSATGNYPFSISDSLITIENTIYMYTVNDTILIIEDSVGLSADGKKLTFVKILERLSTY